MVEENIFNNHIRSLDTLREELQGVDDKAFDLAAKAVLDDAINCLEKARISLRWLQTNGFNSGEKNGTHEQG